MRFVCLVLYLFLSKMSKIFFFVENKGLEPLTPCVQGRCSKPTELIPLDIALRSLFCPQTFFFRFFVVPGRVELPTSTLSVWRSNQLSYRTVRPADSSLYIFF